MVQLHGRENTKINYKTARRLLQEIAVFKNSNILGTTAGIETSRHSKKSMVIPLRSNKQTRQRWSIETGGLSASDIY